MKLQSPGLSFCLRWCSSSLFIRGLRSNGEWKKGEVGVCKCKIPNVHTYVHIYIYIYLFSTVSLSCFSSLIYIYNSKLYIYVWIELNNYVPHHPKQEHIFPRLDTAIALFWASLQGKIIIYNCMSAHSNLSHLYTNPSLEKAPATPQVSIWPCGQTGCSASIHWKLQQPATIFATLDRLILVGTQTGSVDVLADHCLGRRCWFRRKGSNCGWNGARAGWRTWAWHHCSHWRSLFLIILVVNRFQLGLLLNVLGNRLLLFVREAGKNGFDECQTQWRSAAQGPQKGHKQSTHGTVGHARHHS